MLSPQPAALSIGVLGSVALSAVTVVAKTAVGFRVQAWEAHDCHSVGGSLPCVLPFDYQGIKFTSCTSYENEGQLWCATTANFERDRLWANCSCRRLRDSVDSLYVEVCLCRDLAPHVVLVFACLIRITSFRPRNGLLVEISSTFEERVAAAHSLCQLSSDTHGW